MRVYPDLTTFLAQLGTTASGRTVTLDDLDNLAISALKDGLKISLEVPIAVWGELVSDLRYSTVVSEAHPVELLEQRRYEQAEDAIIVVNARWKMSVECCFQNRDTDTLHLWTGIQGVEVEGDIQLFLEERGSELQPAEFISARITSDTYLLFGSDGSVMRMESIGD